MRIPRTYKEWVEDLQYGFALRSISHLVEAVIREPLTQDYALDAIKSEAAYWLELIEVREKRDRKLAQIASLRNTSGRDPEETKEFLRKAAELEAKLDS